MKFCNLHIHSHYSLLDGLSKIDDIIQKALEDGQPAVALTDHGVMYGAIEFYQKCKKAGIKPIIGLEAYLAREGMAVKEISKEERYHVTLLAKNILGYKNLIKITTLAHLQGYYFKPRIDFEVLTKHSEGLICLSGCLVGEVSRMILSKGVEVAESVAKKYFEVFKDDYYLEVQYHPNLPDQKIVNDALFKIGKKLNIPIVASCDAHYRNIEDAEAHDILICLQTKKKIHETGRMSFLGEDFSIHTTDQMADFFRGNPEVLENTIRIADKCNLEISLGEIQLPKFDLPEGINAFDHLTEMCKQGMKERYGFDPDSQVDEVQKKTVERLEYELSIIEKTGYASYFLIVQDFINWSKEQGIVVGPGRGSAAGSIVAYVTRITDLDPLKYDLLFERFLNPDRISMPDIDTDFADIRRDEVLHYVEEKYGKDHVAQIITFGTMAARAAVRDVGRVLDMPYSFCDKVSKLIPANMTLDNAINQTIELKQLYESNPDAKRLIDFARKLEGVARHASTHACGVVITDKPLIEYVPCQYSTTSGSQAVVSQYSLHPVEDLGLLKMDFLGLKNLTIIQKTCEVIEKIHGDKIDISALVLDDQKAFELFQGGETTGVFQFESGGMKRYLKKLKPTVFEDLIAMVALYRPGPLNSGMVDEFIDRKYGQKKIAYLHPIMEQALKNTYGVIVYQEQVMQLSKDMAGFTGGQADTLRKAMGKKNAELMEKMKVEFMAGCINNNLAKKVALETFSSMEKFAEYGFNKSHAACYALIAYQTAYLKANYPAEFMASLLSCDKDNMDRVVIEIDECKRMGMDVLPPDVNESYTEFTVVAESLKDKKPRIRFGLTAIRNLGENIGLAILHERKANGVYQDLDDFLSRVKSKDLNKKSLESLAKSGALDMLSERNNVLGNMDRILLFVKEIENETNNNQSNLFAQSELQSVSKLKLIEYPVAILQQKLSWEKEFLGLYVTSHPFEVIKNKEIDAITALSGLRKIKTNNLQVIVAGVITDIKKIITKKGEPMLFVKIEDTMASVELLIFPKLYQSLMSLFVEEKIIVAVGSLSDKDDEPKLLVDMVWEINSDNCEQVVDQAKVFSPKQIKHLKQKNIIIKYPKGASSDLAEKIKKIFISHPGNCVVFLKIDQQLIRTNFKVRYSSAFLVSIQTILGKGVLIIK